MVNDSSSLKESIVCDLKEVLDQYNPYVKIYRMVQEKMQTNGVSNIRLRILDKRGRVSRTHNLPFTSEVAAFIVGDFYATDVERDIIVETRTGILQHFSMLKLAYLPLQYPLLFPRGEYGWNDDIPISETTTGRAQKRQKVSMRQFFAYRIQQRETQHSLLLFGRRLFQQLFVDAYSMIESNRLQYVRTHQKELRAEIYKGLAETILRGDTNLATADKRIILPSSFNSGARYMHQNNQDAMAICVWAGYPDLFITFTCNHKWPELCKVLNSLGLKSEDRQDLVCRVFKIKLDELIKDIKKGDAFGRVRAVIYTIEFQKHGLPHAHIWLFLHQISRCSNTGDIDKIISTDIQDEHTEPELFKIVSSLMIHGPCGFQNNKSPCMQNGKCTKYFPKKFVDQTSFDADGYLLYKRSDNGRVIKKGQLIC